MKISGKASALGVFLVAGFLGGAINPCRAQVLVEGGGNQAETLVQLSSVPSSGTFWSASMSFPPSPFDPLPQLPLYAYGPASNQVYVYDDENFDYSDSSSAEASANDGGMLPMDDGDPLTPPGGGTNTSGGGGGSSFAYPDFTTNDLWLQITGVTNQTAALVIHPPWNVTNGMYDLLYATNLALPTSWQWVMRTAPGQTNLSVNNATGTQGFYMLGLANNPAGTDFWLTFPNVNGDATANLSLYISSLVGASGMVSITGLEFTQAFSVTPGAVTNISIPGNALLGESGIMTNSIHVTSTQPVSVYGASLSESYSRYTFAAYPTAVLGTNYCVMALPGNSEFAIVATANNTTITITPSTNADLSNSESNSYVVVLQQGEAYEAWSGPGDVTGTVITADAPIGVFAGSAVGYVNAPIENPLAQEQLPVADWGDEALTLSFAGRTGGDAYRVLAVNNGTVVRTNGVVATTLQAGQFYDTIINGAVQFYGSNPIQVAHFANGERYDNPPGFLGSDTEILLPPTSQYSTSYTVYSLPLTTNFVDIVVANNATLTTLDGTNISLLTTNFPAIGTSGYFGVRIPVLPGPHTISGSQSVQVEVYGFQYFTAYGYVGGAINVP
jgi:hypothetical protein